MIRGTKERYMKSLGSLQEFRYARGVLGWLEKIGRSLDG